MLKSGASPVRDVGLRCARAAATRPQHRHARIGRRVTLPIISPAIVAGWLLVFTLSLDDLVISSFVSGPGATTLPMLIFSTVRLGVTPDANALASLIIAAVTCGVVAAGVILRRQQRQRTRDENIRETV
jgi:putrescine transport system permease protein